MPTWYYKLKEYKTTSENQRTMHRISADNPVRRCLFPIDDDEARVDNFVNILQESAARDKMEKMKKWNFDFENEVPLEGTYKWYRGNDPEEWLGIKSEEEDSIKESNDGDPFMSIQLGNEVTPKVGTVKSDLKKRLIRKRKLNILKNSAENVVRRKIDF